MRAARIARRGQTAGNAYQRPWPFTELDGTSIGERKVSLKSTRSLVTFRIVLVGVTCRSVSAVTLSVTPSGFPSHTAFPKLTCISPVHCNLCANNYISIATPLNSKNETHPSLEELWPNRWCSPQIHQICIVKRNVCRIQPAIEEGRSNSEGNP